MKRIFTIIIFAFLVTFNCFAGNELFVQAQTVTAKELVSNSEPTKVKTEVTNDLKVAIQKEVVSDGTTPGILPLTLEQILLGLLAISEVVARVVPSVKDNSILNFFTRLINFLVPNARKGGGNF